MKPGYAARDRRKTAMVSYSDYIDYCLVRVGQILANPPPPLDPKPGSSP